MLSELQLKAHPQGKQRHGFGSFKSAAAPTLGVSGSTHPQQEYTSRQIHPERRLQRLSSDLNSIWEHLAVTTVESFIIFASCPLTAVNYNQTQTAWESTVTYHTAPTAFAVTSFYPYY